jgi:hypothetical protein
VSKSKRTGVSEIVDELEDQIVVDPSRITGFPSLVIVKIPVEFSKGLSLLATHTIVFGDMFLYHMQKYRFCEFPKLKNPASKFPSAEINVSL